MHVSNSSDITNFGAFILNLKLWSDKVSHVRGNCFYNFSQIIYIESMLESYIYNLILGMILIFEIEGENLFYNIRFPRKKEISTQVDTLIEEEIENYARLKAFSEEMAILLSPES